MTLTLVGVVEEDGRRGFSVPQTAYRILRVRVGETTTIKLRVVKASGLLFDLAGWTVTLMVKGRPGPFGDKKIEKIATLTPLLGEETCEFVITSLDTKRMGEENKLRYFYDVVLVKDSDRYVAVPSSPFQLLQSVQSG